MLLKQTIVALDAKLVATSFVSSCLTLGFVPNTNLIATLCGQSAMETGHWRALVCFNFGNVKADQDWIDAGNHYVFYDGDIIRVSENMTQAELDVASKSMAPAANGNGMNMRVARDRGPSSAARYAVYFKDPHPEARFRAFKSAAGGAMGFLLKMTARYQAALDAASQGDIGGYVKELARIVPSEGRWGYFTANVEDYTESVRRNTKVYMAVAASAVTEVNTAGWGGGRIGLCPELGDILAAD